MKRIMASLSVLMGSVLACFAGTNVVEDLTSAATSTITTVGTAVGTILVAMMAIVAAFFVYRKIRASLK